MTSGSRNAHKRFGHKTGNQAVFTRHLCANLAVSRQAISITQNIVKHRVQLQLSGSIFVVTLNNIQTHCLRIFNDFHESRAQFFKLVNVITIRFCYTAIWPSVLTALEPHHFRLRTASQVQSVIFILKLIVNDAQISAAI